MVEEKIKELGFQLQETPKPLAAYIPAIRIDNFIFTSGQLPIDDGKLKYAGRIGENLSEEEGKLAAQIAVLNCLSTVKSIVNNLDKIEQIVKLTVYINSSTTFTNQPEIANGASELLINIFGEKGKHTRSAVGVGSLPRNSSVEIEMILKIKD
jgi:enamine deaminase RidA (YjgF/YER057c/UK114 family)